MGAYGSPQVGYFAELEEQQRKKNQEPPHSKIIWKIIVTIITIYLVVKSIPIIVGTVTLISNNNQTKTNQTEEVSIDRVTNNYLHAANQLEKEINNLLISSFSNNGLQNINTIDIQTYIRKYKNEAEDLKNYNINPAFEEHRDYLYNNCVSTIELMQNYINNRSYNIYTARELEKDFSDKRSEGMILLKKIMRDNNIPYTEKIENGVESVTYKSSKY
jgi:hypothetical protein